MSINFTLRTHGDALERAYSDFLAERLPSYERIWQDFIGNDGNAQLPELPSLSTALQLRRVQISQFTYSAIESVVLARRSLESIRRTLDSSEDAGLTVDRLLDLSDRYVFFLRSHGAPA